LDTNRVFTSLSLFALLQEPLSSFIMALSTFVGSVGCFVRIQSFLDSDVRADKRHKLYLYDSSWSPQSSIGCAEKENSAKRETQYSDNQVNTAISYTRNAISVKDGDFGWKTNDKPILSGINVEVPAGKLTMIVGPVGCGKTTLLKAFLGELNIMRGSVQISSSEIAFCDQTPWLMNGTVRQSIIAFSGGDERWYQLVLKACALEQDIDQLPKGDLTTIGSKGIALSGGQCQRIVRWSGTHLVLIGSC
jgi:ATP-binding cassette, subfamily C (CFTR/MRP), member 1